MDALSNRMFALLPWLAAGALGLAVAQGSGQTALSLAAFGDQTSLMHKTGYVVTAALLAAVAALAPIAYAISQRPVVLDNGEIEYQGFVYTLLAASVLSLWAAFGQLALLIFALRELAGFQVVSVPTSRLFQVLVGALAVALIVYSANSIVQLLSRETTPRMPTRKPQVEGRDFTPAEAPDPRSKAQWRPI